MKQQKGSLIGGALLIGGSCIGVGMLGLPIVTGLCGFYPSLMMFVLAWGFMTLTGLLLIEVNGWFAEEVNLISMVGYSLGAWGKRFCWALYLFLFYSLLVAYLAGIGGVFSSVSQTFFSISIPKWMGSVFFALLFGGVLSLGIKTVDFFNRAFMVGKIGAYLGIVFIGVQYVNPSLLKHHEMGSLFISLPILVISFGFHNMIPTITNYMKGDLKRVKIVVVTGSFLALVVYIIWDLIVLGIVPKEGSLGLLKNLQEGKDASQAIAGILGSSWISRFATGLAFFSLLTSLLIQSLALVHFWADGLRIQKKKKWELLLTTLTLSPPLVFSILNPTIFFKALDFAGGICAVILFGIFPVLMVWIGRYRILGDVKTSYRVRGGKPLLVGVFLFALFIFVFQIFSMIF